MNFFFASFFSFLIHALIFLIFCFGFFRFATSLPLTPSKTPLEAPPEVVFDLSPPVQETRSTLQTAAEHPLEEAPKNASFESHENTEAASELPATGALPLPTQEGHESQGVELRTSETTGKTLPLPSASEPPAEPQAKSQTESQSEAAVSKNDPIVPSPAATTVAKPAPERPVMGTLSAKAKEESGSNPSVIHGSISNKGKSSAAAEATPIGRYKKTLADAISSHWYYCIDQRMELLSFGTATVFFYVTQQGKIEELHIVSNSSNQTFADCCLQSITEAKLPIIPPEIAKTLDKGRLEIEYRFTIYPD